MMMRKNPSSRAAAANPAIAVAETSPAPATPPPGEAAAVEVALQAQSPAPEIPNTEQPVSLVTVPALASEQSQDELFELNLVLDADGLVTLEMLTGLSGPSISLAPKDPYRCEAAEAVRLTRAGFAQQGTPKAEEA
jgi:hypothetical protein